MPRPHFLAALLKCSISTPSLAVGSRDAPLATRIETAFDSASRKRGLLGRESLPTDMALIIAPCSLVHTFRMRFPIDVVFAARDGRIVKIHHAMPANRISGAWRAFAVIEMAAGVAVSHGLVVGQRLEIRR